ESVENQTVNSSPDFLDDFRLLLGVLSGRDSLLLQDLQGFQCSVKPTIQSGQCIVNSGFHDSVLETYYSRFDLDILRLMFMECPHRSENSLAQGFENYDLKRRCFKATWRTRSAFGSPMFRALRLPKKSHVLKSLRCLLRDWTYRSEKYSGISKSSS